MQDFSILSQHSNTWATWCEELTNWKSPWCWERLKAGGEGDDRGGDGWMALLTWWPWVWASSGSWWWTGKPSVLQSMELQRDGHDWETELNWTEWWKWSAGRYPLATISLYALKMGYFPIPGYWWKLTKVISLNASETESVPQNICLHCSQSLENVLPGSQMKNDLDLLCWPYLGVCL